MSLRTWKREFYPYDKGFGKFDADTRPRNDPATDIQKWKGFLPENLKKHNVVYEREDSFELVDVEAKSEEFPESFAANTESCSLCLVFFTYQCEGCPLLDPDGDSCCSTDRGFDDYIKTKDPTLMIAELEAVLKERENNADTGDSSGPGDDN